MTERTPVGFSLTASYDIYQSYQAELREAKDHLEAGRHRDAVGSAQRAWEYYGEFVLALLGMTKAERRELVARRQSFGLHDKRSREYYEERTGDLLSDHPGWSDLFGSKQLRDTAEHRGKPVTAGQARQAISIRLDLMHHIDAVLADTAGVDQAALARARSARESAYPEEQPDT